MWCGHWSPAITEEYKVRVFEGKLLKRAFGPKRVEVTEDWRQLHSEELHDLYCSPDIIRVTPSQRKVDRSCGKLEGKQKCVQGFDRENMAETWYKKGQMGR